MRELGNGINEWSNALIKRFREPFDQALKSFISSKYTVTDVCNRVEPSKYIQNLIRHGKSADITGTRQQLMMAWQGLDPELKLNITRPTATTTTSDFIHELEEWKEIWFEVYKANTGNFR